MRQEILDYINTLSLGGFLLTQELPWIDSGTTALYLKNLKKIYVDIAQFENQPIIQTLNSVNINNETTIVRIYFACDAKQLPTNYDELVQDLKSAKDITTVDAIQRREVNVETVMESDMLVTTVEVRFTRIST